MLIYKIYTFSFLIAISESITLEDYCKIDKQNTPCKYLCVRSSKCGDTGDGYTSLTDSERDFVTERHNECREEVANGTYAEKNLPAAANIKVMSYDKECEFMAGCYIKQCIFEHDRLRISSKGDYMGQNLYTMSASSKKSMDEAFIKRGINAWFREVDLVTPALGQSFMKSFQMTHATGHFTQVVWPSTEYVGCAKMHSIKTKSMYTYDLFCNYKPAGNVQSKPMYITGKPSCEVNNQFPNLCGTIRPLSMDDYKPPIDLNAGTSLYSIKLLILFGCGLIFYCCISFC